MEPHQRRPLLVPAICVLVANLAAPAMAHTQAAPSVEGPVAETQDVSRQHPIDNDSIVRMSRAGLSDDILIQTIQLQPGRFDTSPDSLILLKRAGLSDRVISVLQAHGTGLGIRGIPREGGAGQYQARVQPVPQAPLPLGVDEIGVYFQDKSGTWTPLHTERVIFKSGGAAKSLFTHGIISKDMNGHVSGEHATLALKPGTPLLIYAPPSTDSSEYVFLQFRGHADNREFRVLTGGVFHSHSGSDRDAIDFTAKKIAPQTYTFDIPADIVIGEYGVLPPATSNQQSIAGTSKIFTFSISK